MAGGMVEFAETAQRALQMARRGPWSGLVYRVHGPIWNGDDPGGSLLASGRWNIGGDDPTGRDPFPVLYTATSAHVATWEYVRHSWRDDAKALWERLRTTTTHLNVDLPTALDLRQPDEFGLPPDALIGDDYGLAQEVAVAAYAAGLSGILAPTATGLGARTGEHNVVVFFEATGETAMVYGFPTAATRRRSGVTVEIRHTERVTLPP